MSIEGSASRGPDAEPPVVSRELQNTQAYENLFRFGGSFLDYPHAGPESTEVREVQASGAVRQSREYPVAEGVFAGGSITLARNMNRIPDVVGPLQPGEQLVPDPIDRPLGVTLRSEDGVELSGQVVDGGITNYGMDAPASGDWFEETGWVPMPDDEAEEISRILSGVLWGSERD